METSLRRKDAPPKNQWAGAFRGAAAAAFSARPRQASTALESRLAIVPLNSMRRRKSAGARAMVENREGVV
jgi:hypothetical protein